VANLLRGCLKVGGGVSKELRKLALRVFMGEAAAIEGERGNSGNYPGDKRQEQDCSGQTLFYVGRSRKPW
jgi:hypothetical protein